MSIRPIGMPIDLPSQLENIRNSLTKPLNALLNIPQWRGSISRAEVHIIAILLALRTEPRAAHEQRAAGDDGVEDLVLDFRAALGRVGRVLGVVDAHPVEHAGGGRAPGDDGLGDGELAGVEEHVAARRVLGADVQEPVQVAGVAPVFVEELEEHELRHARGGLRGDVGVLAVAVDDLLAGRDPADARAGRDDLAEGVEAHHAPVGVQGEVAGDEGAEEVGVGGGRCGGGRVQAGVRVHLEEVVGLVFEDDEVVFLRDGVDLLAPLDGLRGAGGVLTGRDGVEDEGFGAAANRLVPVGEDLVQSVCAKTTSVDANTGHLDAHGRGGLDGGGECEFFTEDPVATLAEHSQAHVDRAGRSNSHGAAPVLDGRRVDDLGVFDDPTQELSRTKALTVVECSGNVEVGRAVSEIVLAGRKHGIFRLAIERARLGYLDLQLFKGKVLARRQTSA